MYDPLRAKAKVVFYSAVAFLFGLGMASGLGWTSTSHAMPAISEAPQVSEAAVQPALDLSDAFVRLAEAVTPAVVRIEVKRPVPVVTREVPEAFRRFFDIPQQRRRPQPNEGRLAGGSGFVVSADGYILTNNHVVEGADEIRVIFNDRRYYEAEVVGTDPFTDVALLKIDADRELSTLSFGNSDDVRVGEWILAIGNPGFGAGTRLDYTVTAGIVSARGRPLGLLQDDLRRDPSVGTRLASFAIEDFIQTDAVINPGNSGGPMVDLSGRVVGINSAIASTTGYYQGYGFAIPINLARRVMEDLVEYGHVRRGLLGVEIDAVDPEDADAYGLPSVSGVLIQNVTEGSPADEAGLRQEDVILEVDGDPVSYEAQLQSKIAQRHPGDEVDLTIFRDGRERHVKVRLGEAPINEVATQPSEHRSAAVDRLGINVEELTPEIAQELRYEEAGGVVVSDVLRASPADRRNVPVWWKIVRINDTEVSTPADVRRALEEVEGGQIVSLHMENWNGQTRVINIRMPD